MRVTDGGPDNGGPDNGGLDNGGLDNGGMDVSGLDVDGLDVSGTDKGGLNVGGLDVGFLAEVDGWLAPADAQAALFAGERSSRQPVHTVYVPADQYRVDTPQLWGRQALALMDEHAPTPQRFAELSALPIAVIDEVYARTRAKLDSQPIEDLRVDFEDGYGIRPDDEEDAAARAAGAALAQSALTHSEPAHSEPAHPEPAHPEPAHPAPAQSAQTHSSAPFLLGIRIKGLQAATRRRGLRTLDLVVRAAVEAGGLPTRFVVTLPKVAHVAEVTTAVRICERLEATYDLAPGALRFELQIEVPQAVVGPTGVATVAPLLHAAQGRCEGLHYGTYDFSAAAGVVAGEQSLEHPLADHAKAVMQLAAAGSGVRVSDGSTNVVPVGTPQEIAGAWRQHARLVGRSLRGALYQGWDLHPGHLVTRYAATYDFYRAQLAPSCHRLAGYTTKAASGVMDEPATAQALATAVLRAVDCGACDDAEVSAATGLDRAALLALARRPPDPIGAFTPAGGPT